MDDFYGKEVKFSEFCPNCMWKEKEEDGSDPCESCLEVGARTGTVKPVNFKEKLHKNGENL